MNPEDRLSDLPDCILCHILSFLPTKYAIRTSAVSTKWKHLFPELTNIHIDDYLICLNPWHDHKRKISRNHFDTFTHVVDFVNRRLEETPISEFRLKCRCFPEPQVMSSWISKLHSSHIKVVDLHSDAVNPRNFSPAGILQSPSLEILRLHGTIFLQLPGFVLVPNLKVLILESVEIQSESNSTISFTHENFPMLEELSLVHIKYTFQWIKNVEISLHTLRKLNIQAGLTGVGEIDIHTPHLQHLNCRIRPRWFSGEGGHINMRMCESLVSADLKEFSSDDWSNIEFLSNVKELHISEECNNTGPFSRPEDMLLYFTQNLREIKLIKFDADEVHFKLARCFLEQGAVLEKMIIGYPSHIGESGMLMLLLPKCEVVIQKKEGRSMNIIRRNGAITILEE